MNTKNQKNQTIGACPECDADIHFSKAPYLGQKKRCPDCAAELEVISVSPIELDWEFDYEFDEDDYEDDF